AEGRQGQVWGLSLPASGPIDFQSSGQPDFVLGATLPGSDWLRQALESLGRDADMELARLDGWLEGEIGVDLSTLVETFACRMLIVDDAICTCLVLEGGCVERWSRLLDALSRGLGIRQSTRRIDTREIHHLAIPGIAIDEGLDELCAGGPGMTFIMTRLM